MTLRTTSPASIQPALPVRSQALLGLLLFATIMAIYLPSYRYDFLNYDDPDYVTHNPMVAAGLSWQGLTWAFTTGHAANWHPLTWISHMLDCQIYGLKAGGHHLTNTFIHALNTALTWFLMLRLTGAPMRSLFIAALFGLHPMHVESVAWISERKDVLSGFFALLTLIFYTRHVRPTRTRHQPSTINHQLALSCFALGLMSKPMLVTLPFVLLLLDVWPLKRFQSPGDPLRLAREKLPFFVLAAASSTVTFLVQQHGQAVQSLDQFSLGQRLQNAVVAYARYLAKTFWPFDLATPYPHPGSWPWAWVAGSCILLLALSLLCWRARKDQPWLVVGWLWFLGMLVPVIGLVQVGSQSMADRYSYLPHLGLFVAVVWTVSQWLARVLPAPSRQAPVVATLAAAVILGCGWRTSDQIGYWKNDGTLFGHALKVSKRNDLAHNQYGSYLHDLGRLFEAEQHFRAAIAISPNYSQAIHNLGYALETQKRYAEAITEYKRALNLNPDQVETLVNLGGCNIQVGQLVAANPLLERAIQLSPKDAVARRAFGKMLVLQNRADEAMTQFNQAAELSPGDAAAIYNEAAGLMVTSGDLAQAIEAFRSSLAAKPDDASTHNNLAVALAQADRVEEAQIHSGEAVRISPHFLDAQKNHALILLKLGRKKEAINHLNIALQIQTNHIEVKALLEKLEENPHPREEPLSISQ